MRGVQPLFDVAQHDVAFAGVCVGATQDTIVILRNLGNAPLTVNQITTTGSPWFQHSQPTPVVLDSGEQLELQITIQPDAIGTASTEIAFDIDGDWFTPLDTTLRLTTRALLCGVVTVDTIDAPIGLVSTMRVQLTPDERTQLTADDLARLLADQGAPVRMSLRTDRFIARFTNDLGGATANGIATTTPDDIQIDAPSTVQEQPLAIVSVDVLLGSQRRTPVQLEIETIANGLYDLQINDGLIRSEYCAWDQRTVTYTGPVMVWTTLVGGSPVIKMTSSEHTTVQLDLVDLAGRCVDVVRTNVHQGETKEHVPAELPAGVYSIHVRSAGSAEYTVPMLVPSR